MITRLVVGIGVKGKGCVISIVGCYKRGCSAMRCDAMRSMREAKDSHQYAEVELTESLFVLLYRTR